MRNRVDAPGLNGVGGGGEGGGGGTLGGGGDEGRGREGGCDGKVGDGDRAADPLPSSSEAGNPLPLTKGLLDELSMVSPTTC